MRETDRIRLVPGSKYIETERENFDSDAAVEEFLLRNVAAVKPMDLHMRAGLDARRRAAGHAQ